MSVVDGEGITGTSCATFLPRGAQTPKIRWVQRSKFVVIVAEGEGKPVAAAYMMSDDGLSFSLMFRTTTTTVTQQSSSPQALEEVERKNRPRDDDSSEMIWGVTVPLFDAVVFGAVEGPECRDRSVQIGFVKLHRNDWPRLTSTTTPSMEVSYDWDLDDTYEDDDDDDLLSHSSSSASEEEEEEEEEIEDRKPPAVLNPQKQSLLPPLLSSAPWWWNGAGWIVWAATSILLAWMIGWMSGIIQS